MPERISAVFSKESDAEQAVHDLRDMGIKDDRLSIVARHGGRTEVEGKGSMAADHDREAATDRAKSTGTGLATGAGIGALFGLAAAFIPGVGPFIAAGFLAPALGATAGTIVSGAIVGGVVGLIAGALANAGYEEHEAHFYGEEIHKGGVLVAVDTKNIKVSESDIEEAMRRHNGRSYSVYTQKKSA